MSASQNYYITTAAGTATLPTIMVSHKDIWFHVNKNPTDATVCRYLFTAKLLYMFRVSQHPSSGVLKTVPYLQPPVQVILLVPLLPSNVVWSGRQSRSDHVLSYRGKTCWQLASRCCWNCAHPWHASELVSFLVGLRTYEHPGRSISRKLTQSLVLCQSHCSCTWVTSTLDC